MLSHTLTRFKSCFGCATKWSVHIMSSTESSSQSDLDTSTQSSAASSRASTSPQRKRRARETTRGGKTAFKEFEDKYFTFPPPSEPSVPSAQPDQIKLVVGNLRRHISAREKIRANEFILSVIRGGYKIPLYETTHSAYFKNNKSALSHSDFVSAEDSCFNFSLRAPDRESPP